MSANPAAEALRTHRRELAAVFCARIGPDVSFYVFTVHLLSDLDHQLPGLLAGVHTRGTARAFRTARRLEVGMVWSTTTSSAPRSAAPKQSGYGCEQAIETLREFGHTKMIRLPSGLGTIRQWRATTDVFGDR